MSLNVVWQQVLSRPTWSRLLLLGFFLLADSYFGMIHNVGVVAWSGLFSGEIKWLMLSVEMMVGGLLLVRTIIHRADHKWKSIAVISSPVLVVLIAFGVLEFLLNGLGRSATINFNLSSIGFSGLYWSAAYLIIGIGLTLTYKVQRFANFAQAEMMLVGSYVALTLMWSDRFFPLADAPGDGSLNWELLIWAGVSSFVIAGVFGLIIDKLVYRRFRNKMGSPQVMMIASLGISMIIRAVLFMRFSASNFRFIPDRDWRLSTSTFDIPTQRLQLHLGDRLNVPFMEMADNVMPYGYAYTKVILVVGIFAVIGVLLLLLYRTRLGRQMRAVADNPGLAASSGIHVERVHGSTAFLSSGIAGFGGALLASILPINPELGLSLLLPAFAVIVLGTIGSIPGLIVGALIVGLLRAGSESVLIGAGNALDRPTASGFAEVMPFIFLVGLLMLAPRGIGSAIHDWNIERIRKRRLSHVPKSSQLVELKVKRFSIFAGPVELGRIYFDYFNGVVVRVAKLANSTVEIAYGLPARYLETFSSKVKLISTGFITFVLIPKVALGNRIKINRETERGSWIMFAVFFLLLFGIVWLLPSVSNLTKTMQVARIVTLLGIFGLAAFSLNLHTGFTGMTNFGVIFFIGLGAVTVGLLSAPVETNGYGWSPLAATAFAVAISGVAGWLLAYPTARLRMDYFAIVTISLGEMLRISLQAEPLLRAGTVTSAIGISQYARPLENWWESGPDEIIGGMLGLHVPAPYVVFLAGLAAVFLVLIWFLLNTLLASPWGRILRSIREDEVVSQHHGHNILIHKAASLALGAAIAALAGALWAWLNTNVWPDFMNPVRSTFLIWAAFIVGGRGNNRGMIIGAFVIVIVEFVLNVMVASRGALSLPLHDLTSYLDSIFSWIIVDVGGLIWSDRSITEIFPRENIVLSLPHFKLSLIGLLIVTSLLTSSKGLLPEVPGRPRRPVLTERNLRDEGNS